MNSVNARPRRTRIFSESDEWYFLGLPIFILIAALIFLALDWRRISSDDQLLVNFILYTFGLQTAHNAFSICMLFLPNFRAWMQERHALTGKNPAVHYALVIAAMFAFWFTFSMPISPFSGVVIFGMPARRAVWFVFWAYNFWHTTIQMPGLTILYNKRHLLEHPEDAALVSRVEKIERKVYLVFALCSVAGFTLLIMKAMPQAGRAPFAVALTCLGLAILALGRLYPAPLRRSKLLFNIRLFLFPLYPYSNVGAFGKNVTHNFEYWMVYKKLVRHSYTRMLVACSLAFVMLTCASALARHDLQTAGLLRFFSQHGMLWALVKAFSMTITTAHYYLDGQYFHLSEPLTRKHIGKMLLTNEVGELVAAPVASASAARSEIFVNGGQDCVL